MKTYFGLKQDTLQKCMSIVRSAVKQYRVSILLILLLKFLFHSIQSQRVDFAAGAGQEPVCRGDSRHAFDGGEM